MKERRLSGATPVLLCLGLLCSPVASAAQSGSPAQPPAVAPPAGPPPPPKNLQFYPKDTKRPELIENMRQFSFALGVRCEYCHVDEEGPNARRDFASDEKEAKVKARAMLRMTKQINDDLLAAIPHRASPAVEVTCATCHHGLSHPESLADRLSAAAGKGGPEGAVAELKKLRESSEFGRFDVSEWGVNQAASALSRSGKLAEALAVLEANASYHPGSKDIPALMAEVHIAMGHTEIATDILKKLLAADPENRRLKQMLDRLTKGDEARR